MRNSITTFEQAEPAANSFALWLKLLCVSFQAALGVVCPSPQPAHGEHQFSSVSQLNSDDLLAVLKQYFKINRSVSDTLEHWLSYIE